jgi:hypothetical protein
MAARSASNLEHVGVGHGAGETFDRVVVVSNDL